MRCLFFNGPCHLDIVCIASIRSPILEDDTYSGANDEKNEQQDGYCSSQFFSQMNEWVVGDPLCFLKIQKPFIQLRRIDTRIMPPSYTHGNGKYTATNNIYE